jgi:large subunit ribosomal protein L25
MSEELKVEIRSEQGKLNNRRLRAAGRIPAVLYGHGQDNLSLSVSADDFRLVLRHGSRLVSLTGAVNDSAFVRELQWDTWGTHLLHIDFTRISLDEKVEVEVEIGLRGEAPGVREGGVVQQLMHQVQISCPAGSIPDRLWVKINELKLDGEILASDLELPAGATLLDEPDQVVVQCMVPTEVDEEGTGVSGPAEPEVIGGKKEEDEEE